MTKNQNGFTADRGTDDDIFTSRMLLQKARQHGVEMWCLAFAFTKAFDSGMVPLEGEARCISYPRVFGSPGRCPLIGCLPC
jgi:hypothetical protein